jgi:transcriptional regulator with XRE-family HTH domain
MKNLKKIRSSLGMTQGELARRTKLTPAAISQIESGKRDPSLSSILAILKVIPAKFEVLAGIEADK